jgi:hypothetical protein
MIGARLLLTGSLGQVCFCSFKGGSAFSMNSIELKQIAHRQVRSYCFQAVMASSNEAMLSKGRKPVMYSRVPGRL